jgi:hypothetical protein
MILLEQERGFFQGWEDRKVNAVHWRLFDLYTINSISVLDSKPTLEQNLICVQLSSWFTTFLRKSIGFFFQKKMARYST